MFFTLVEAYAPVEYHLIYPMNVTCDPPVECISDSETVSFVNVTCPAYPEALYDGVRLYPGFERIAPSLATLLEYPGAFCTACEWCVCTGRTIPSPFPFGEQEAYDALRAQPWSWCGGSDPCTTCNDSPSPDDHIVRCDTNGTHRVVSELVLRDLGMEGPFPQEALNRFQYFTLLDMMNSSVGTPNLFDPTPCVNITRCALPGVECYLPIPLCSSVQAIQSQGEFDIVRTAMIAIGVIVGVFVVVGFVVYVLPKKERQKRLSMYFPTKDLSHTYESGFVTLTNTRNKSFSVQKVPAQTQEITVIADADGTPMVKDV